MSLPIVWYIVVAIFVVGVGGVMVVRDLLRKVIALSLANSAIIMLWVLQAAEKGVNAPILEGAAREAAAGMADPLPQALMLTAIVVGICVIALAVVLLDRLYRRHGTLDMHELEKKIWSHHE